ncbi:MAG: ribose ABC transporter permease, partial [Sphaerochaetaceae bacterium]|nr:ribose ABC transporter permease [Sphaerochaetaceae bacterium]
MNRTRVIDIIRSNGILLVILLLIIVTGITESNFLTVGNLLNVLRQVAVVGIVACGMTYCIIGGAFDLSVGSVVSLAGVITILNINAGTNEYVAVAYGLLAGVATGVI